MEITIFDRVLLLLTGLVAVYLVFRFYQEMKDATTKPKYNIFYIISFAVLFVSGVLIIIFGFEVLERPCIKTVATILPFGLAIGLIYEFFKKLGVLYLIVMIVGLVLIGLQSFGVFEAKIIYPIFHAIAGLTIFIVPILAVSEKKAPGGFIWVRVGGALIGIGGIALAFLGAGKPLLGIFTAEVVFTILTPILFLMSLGFAWGFMKKIKKA